MINSNLIKNDLIYLMEGEYKSGTAHADHSTAPTPEPIAQFMTDAHDQFVLGKVV
jgi:hypothetical protein